MFAPEAHNYGWHYFKEYNLYQKVYGRVFVYVSKMLGNQFMVQLYRRGRENMGTCLLEVRTSNPARLEDMFLLGDLWLVKYKEGHLEAISDDFYYIANPNGAWGLSRNIEKLYWI